MNNTLLCTLGKGDKWSRLKQSSKWFRIHACSKTKSRVFIAS